MTDLKGTYLGRYQLIEQLGRGGMATVYRAFDTQLERDVAIKVILQNEAHSEAFLARFKREAKTLARLSHPNIVKVLDYGEQDGLPYLVMEYIQDGSLASRLSFPVPWSRAAELLVPVARALEYAHRHGIIHRDIKPSNILLSEAGAPMLSDFGIARILQQHETVELTHPGMGIGTPEYMAPEQGLGVGVDNRADIYSLGVVFYEMVTGMRPFSADTPLAVLLKKHSEPLAPPSQYVPDLPEDVEHFLFKLVAREPDERISSMEEVATGLEKICQGVPLTGGVAPPVDGVLTRQFELDDTLPAWVPAWLQPTRLSSARQRLARLYPGARTGVMLLSGALILILFLLLRAPRQPLVVTVTGGTGVPAVEFASISDVTGRVVLVLPGERTIPVANGMKLVVSGSFRVRSSNGQARLQLTSGPLICIPSHTEVEFLDGSTTQTGLNLNLIAGRLLFIDDGEQDSVYTLLAPFPLTIISRGAVIGLEKNRAGEPRLDLDCLDGVCTFASPANRLDLLDPGHTWLGEGGLSANLGLPRLEMWNSVCADQTSPRLAGAPTPTGSGLLDAFSRLIAPERNPSITPESLPATNGLGIPGVLDIVTMTPTRIPRRENTPTPRPREQKPAPPTRTATLNPVTQGTSVPPTATNQPPTATAAAPVAPDPTQTQTPQPVSEPTTAPTITTAPPTATNPPPATVPPTPANSPTEQPPYPPPSDENRPVDPPTAEPETETTAPPPAEDTPASQGSDDPSTDETASAQ